jgi:trimeric autotransporter adhesin
VATASVRRWVERRLSAPTSVEVSGLPGESRKLRRRLSGAIAFLWLATLGVASGQSIVTVAGSGTDDGRPSTAASLYGPGDVALDSLGNLYIADYFNHRVRKVFAKSGVMVTVAGNGARGFSGDGGPATAAGIAYPDRVSLDGSDNLYIADQGNNRIRRVAAGTGVITTVAGSDAIGFSGDGGPATAARLNGASGVALDRFGNLYIADTFNHRIRKVDGQSGIISTVAGNGKREFSGDGAAATAAGLAVPRGVVADASGNLYIADTGNHRVRRVDAQSRIISTVAGNRSDQGSFSGDGGPATEAGLFLPAAVTFDSAGNLYIADAGNHRIRKVAAGSGIISTVAGNGTASGTDWGSFSGDGGPATAAGLASPGGIAFDGTGNLYIADSNNQRVRKVAAGTGTISTVAGNGSYGFSGDGGPATGTIISFAFGLTVDSSGNLYIADAGSDRIRKVAAGSGTISTVAGSGNSSGEFQFYGDGGPATAAGIYNPIGIIFDSAGNLYIADTYNHRVRKVDAKSGIISTIAGNGTNTGNGIGTFSGDGGPATAAGLYQPVGLALDASGNLYIADTENHRIRMVAAGSGIISTVAGTSARGFSGDGGPATAAQLYFPEGLALDASGNLYIADEANSRIRRLSLGTGIISTVAGTGTAGFSGDGGPATAARLVAPTGVALDRSGNLYIADAGDNRIRKVAAGVGTISTIAGNGSFSAAGDDGPATAAGLNNPFAVAADDSGNVYIGSSGAVRAVFACVTVPTPNLQQPSSGSLSVPTSPKLAWSPVKGAFHYDIYLDTVNPPQKLVATDVTSTSYSPANLEALSKYYWKVVAKGDSFCTPFSTASSDVWSFTTVGTCSAPGSFGAAGSSEALE